RSELLRDRKKRPGLSLHLPGARDRIWITLIGMECAAHVAGDLHGIGSSADDTRDIASLQNKTRGITNDVAVGHLTGGSAPLLRPRHIARTRRAVEGPGECVGCLGDVQWSGGRARCLMIRIRCGEAERPVAGKIGRRAWTRAVIASARGQE